ncbi:MAG TPA: lipid-A-disaccharide synthase, partial [Synergistetes bacterium]|nr:lipid-A-disaccharide synthase [Synergistota bacterium]
GDPVWSSSSLSLMGISEVLGSVPRLLKLKNEMVREILHRDPSAVVVIDSPDFHIPLVKDLRTKGYKGKVFYLAPPTVWAWRQARADLLARYCDLCFPLFGFERDFLESRGAPCRWFGHPLANLGELTVPATIDSRDFSKIAALLPGSRKSEVLRLLPVLSEASVLLEERGFCPVFSMAPGLDAGTLAMMKETLKGREIYEGPGAELMAASDVVVGASGTAAVEALILRRYMIVLYKASLSSWITWKLFVRTPRISVPNILAGEEIYPELLQSKAKARNIVDRLDGSWGDPEEKKRIEKAMERAASALGGKEAPRGWAESILEMIRL